VTVINTLGYPLLTLALFIIVGLISNKFIFFKNFSFMKKLPINFVQADKNYLNSDSKIVKGKFPQKNNEIAVESFKSPSSAIFPDIILNIWLHPIRKL